MLRDDGQLAPGLYRVTLDDGTTGDYELTGYSQLDHGDLVTFQPTAVGEIALDAQLVAGRIVLVVSEDGHVWHIPGNRLKDAEPVEGEQLDLLAAAYLKQAPFHPPTRDGRMTAAERRALAGLPKPAEAVADREDEAYPAANPRRIPETSGVSEPITPGTFDPKARSRRGNGPAESNLSQANAEGSDPTLPASLQSDAMKDSGETERQALGMQQDERAADVADRTVATGETPPGKFGADLTPEDADKLSMLKMSPPPGSPQDPMVSTDAMPGVAMPGERPFDEPSNDASGLFSETTGPHDPESPDAPMESEPAKTIEGITQPPAAEPELSSVEAATALNATEHGDHGHAEETLTVDRLEDQPGS